ncbi:hypothetical protein [Bizionia sp.]|uniref:hypothetical protein n=1 Tax=Bizionia sp. TaxID=1954480 RepID=UPI003A924284
MEKLLKLNSEIEKLKSLIIKDYNNREMFNYYILSGFDDEFISINNLYSFITKNEIKNLSLLNEIVNNCYAIIHIIDYDVRENNNISFKLNSPKYYKKDNFEVHPDDIYTEGYEFKYQIEAYEGYRFTRDYSFRILKNNSKNFDFEEKHKKIKHYIGPIFDLKDIVIRCEEILNIILKSFPQSKFNIEENMIFFDRYTKLKKDNAGSTYSKKETPLTKFPIKKINKNDLKYESIYNNLTHIGQNVKVNNELDTSHYHIFKFGAFNSWQRMFRVFHIDEDSRTDIKFMFEAMKNHKLIHSTVSQTSLLEWILESYNLEIGKTNNLNNSKYRISVFEESTGIKF